LDPLAQSSETVRLRRILIVDDSPIFLAAVASLLPATEEIEVIGTAGSGREAIEKASALEPDLVLMDVAMPEMNGLEAARQLAILPLPPRVIIMTTHTEKAYRNAALKCGADGFLLKSELEDELLPLIRTLLPEYCGQVAPTEGSPRAPEIEQDRPPICHNLLPRTSPVAESK
jgi:DNA-binding NarL/FixJ family response regulator